MHAWLSAVQQCMNAETVSTDAAESQPAELLVLFCWLICLNSLALCVTLQGVVMAA